MNTAGYLVRSNQIKEGIRFSRGLLLSSLKNLKGFQSLLI